jgi:putative phosphoribosyl transferase
MRYKDRTHAGHVLAQLLSHYGGKSCVVLGLPNGGIPVGIEIAKEFGFDFDLLFVSKITPKFNTEIGYGSVSESGEVNLNRELMKRLGLGKEEVEEDIAKTARKIASRMKKYVLKDGRCDIEGRIVILVDDGIASGYTMINARDTVKKRGAQEIVIAVPTAPLEKYNLIRDMVDEIVCPDVRDVAMFAVADAYDNWYDISFEGAIKFLMKFGYME